MKQKWKTHLKVKLEGTKGLKEGSDCQADIGVLLEPCFVNLSTLYLTSMQQSIMESMKMTHELCSNTKDRTVESKFKEDVRTIILK